MELVVESGEPEPGIRRGWFRLTGVPADVELTFECELGYTFDPVVWGQGFAGRRVAFATERATFCGCRTRVRPFDAACCYQVTSPPAVVPGYGARLWTTPCSARKMSDADLREAALKLAGTIPGTATN
jgi:hypothetical protein